MNESAAACTGTADAAAKPAFLVDHMLVKLGKYLRILGYDATWDKALRTHELIRRANAEGRVFVSRNTRLPHQYPAADRLVSVVADDPARQLEALVARLGLDTGRWLFSRCICCNVDLGEVTDRRSIESQVHPNVYRRHERFYKCPCCGTVFWKGTHVANTRAKLGV